MKYSPRLRTMRQQKAVHRAILLLPIFLVWNGTERHKFFYSLRVSDIRPRGKTGLRFSAPDTATLGPFPPLRNGYAARSNMR
jgi:hypothetical protein